MSFNQGRIQGGGAKRAEYAPGFNVFVVRLKQVRAIGCQLSYRRHGKSTICRGRFASKKCYQPTIVKTIISAHIMKAQAA